MKAKFLSLLTVSVLFIACDAGDPIEAKKQELTDAKTELFTIKEKIANLEQK